MLKYLFFTLTFYLATSLQPAPNVEIKFDYQLTHVMLDINSAEGFVMERGLFKPLPNIGYDRNVPKYAPLNESFSFSINEPINQFNSIVSGVYGEDEASVNDETVTVSFGVITEQNNLSTSSDGRRIWEGRLGINPWMDNNDSLAEAVPAFPRKAFSILGGYDDELALWYTTYAFNKCFLEDAEEEFIKLPLNLNKDKFLQIEASGFSINKFVSKRKFKTIFSTTSLNIGVPSTVYNQITRYVKEIKVEKGHNVIDCKSMDQAKDIVIDVNGQNFTLFGNLYTEKVNDVCYLRVRKVEGDSWILGLNFYKHYATCLNFETLSVQLNKMIIDNDDDELKPKKVVNNVRDSKNGIYTVIDN